MLRSSAAVALFFSSVCLASQAFAQLSVANAGTENATLLFNRMPLFKVGPLPEVVPFAVAWGSTHFPHEAWLDWMAKHDLGYGRVYPENSVPWTPYDADKRLFPFEVDHWQDGRPIVDLTKFSKEYWDNFARVIQECADRGIVLQMQLYQRVFFQQGAAEAFWHNNYFNPANNINKHPVPAGQGGYPIWREMTRDTPWRGIHRQWVEHILDGIGDKGNVIIDLMNEGAYKNQLPQEWIDQTLDIIEDWERRTGNELIVGMDFDHFYKKNDPGLEYVLSHPRLDVLICEGSEGHVVPDLVAGDRRKLDVHLAIDYRRKYKKPLISTNSPGGDGEGDGYCVTQSPDAIRCYQWYSLAVKCQGAGVYAKNYPLDFTDPAVAQYARESRILMDFFANLRDYAALAPVPEKIRRAPGKRQALLESPGELVVYLHHAKDAAVGGPLEIDGLAMADGPVRVQVTDPRTGERQMREASVTDGRLHIELPVFEQDIALHVLPARP